MPLILPNDKIYPEDIKNMDIRDLELLTYEIRDFLISKVSNTGGHLASNLGIVEITLALHKVFNTPADKIVWDVGHQCYVHKMITGRMDKFDLLRQTNGMSGFPKTDESAYDVFNSGHSSTSISAAMGLANARDIRNENHNVVAVIGDGAMTGGLAFEGLNNAGTQRTNMIVVLNDNEMSISESTGSISLHLNKLRASKSYQDTKKKVKSNIGKIAGIGQPIIKGIEKTKDLLRYAVVSQGIFEDMGFRYYGPVDGNNIAEMIEILNMAKGLNGPILIHAMTKKGKGYKNAEKNPSKFHGIGPFDPETGIEIKKYNFKSYSKVFGDKLIKLGTKDNRILGITAAMKDGTGMAGFAERFPQRFFDVGIAEAHAVTFASGLALGGFIPFINIYSTFMQRAYDQIIMDVCLQNLPVVFMLDRAGHVGADGETHHGVFDVSYLKHMPNMTVLAPSSGEELEKMMEYAVSLNGPCAIRFPRGDSDTLVASDGQKKDIEHGKSALISTFDVSKKSPKIHIWALGKSLMTGLEVGKLLQRNKISVKVIDPRFVKPLDENALLKSVEESDLIVTIEDNVVKGGFGESVDSFLMNANIKEHRVFNVGWPDKFIPQGNTDEIMKKYGLDPQSVLKQIMKILDAK